MHGSAEPFWIWVEDPVNNHIYHHEMFLIAKKHVIKREAQEMVFTIPIFEPLPSQYYVRAVSCRNDTLSVELTAFDESCERFRIRFLSSSTGRFKIEIEIP